ncbi:MAG TPA: hypothetical protein DHV46_09885 [Desulfovibrio piger]|uniref:Uncharacterized protein n=1 Tax=Nitratidesulfovibrio vulgaris (strain ATCC 29579 / DSM 644 / CCUG 34227 / NCIMB 8303 / VKM B-1760 / Hildenborough) TaxID=882 RepID=Q72EY3_NITV2|nr:hypothetical protein DVU_0435 [Nitratidesulfovibrio vulgaris str. Hildenborough]HCZ44820.1 hypothetical protein [Desulfovibrio piger]
MAPIKQPCGNSGKHQCRVFNSYRSTSTDYTTY